MVLKDETYESIAISMKIKVDECKCLNLKTKGYVYKTIEPNLEWFNLLKLHNYYMNIKEK